MLQKMNYSRKRKSKKSQNANIRLSALKEILYAYPYMFHQ